MQILLNDETRKLIENIDTSKFGWGNDPKLKDNPKFKTLREFGEKRGAEYGR